MKQAYSHLSLCQLIKATRYVSGIQKVLRLHFYDEVLVEVVEPTQYEDEDFNMHYTKGSVTVRNKLTKAVIFHVERVSLRKLQDDVLAAMVDFNLDQADAAKAAAKEPVFTAEIVQEDAEYISIKVTNMDTGEGATYGQDLTVKHWEILEGDHCKKAFAFVQRFFEHYQWTRTAPKPNPYKEATLKFPYRAPLTAAIKAVEEALEKARHEVRAVPNASTHMDDIYKVSDLQRALHVLRSGAPGYKKHIDNRGKVYWFSPEESLKLELFKLRRPGLKNVLPRPVKD